MESSLESLQDRLGYRFDAPALLTQALTHRSHGRIHNERLEFLGDSVLNCAVAAMLYGRFGRYDEGDLSRLRSNLVKQQSLYEIAQALAIGEVLVLGEGERRSGGLKRPSILADTVEAIVGAVFLDGGFDAAQALIGRLYEPILKSVDPKTLGKDAKTLLQEYLQGKRIPLPVYEVVATHGAAHSQVFEVECSIPKLGVRVSGSGGSRRAAEQSAAKLALEEAMRRQPATVRKARMAVRPAASPQAGASAAAADEAVPPASPPAGVGAGEVIGKEVVAKEGAARDVAAKDVASKDAAAKDVAAKDSAAKDVVAKDVAAKARLADDLPVAASEAEAKEDVPKPGPTPARRLPREAASRDPLPLGDLVSVDDAGRPVDPLGSRRPSDARLASGTRQAERDGEPTPLWQPGRQTGES